MILAEAAAASSELRTATRTGRARVAVGIGKNVVDHLMPEVIRRLRESRPDLSLTLLEGWSPELFGRLLHGDLDFVISAPAPPFRHRS